jgi:hypothetical protein
MFDHTTIAPLTDALSRPREKWKAAAIPGWQPLPDVLLRNQAKLGLTATDMLVLINVLSHWWYVDQKPFPRVTTIARRMGVTVRTVQRSILRLVEKGFLERRKEDCGPNGEERDVLDPKGLVDALGELAINDPAYLVKQNRGTSADGLAKVPF